MPYPWPSFGTFVFQRDESALDGLGGVWNYESNESRSRALGSLTDNVILLSIGSPTREFECFLSPTRLNELRALLYTINTFTEWRYGRSIAPDSRSARLDAVEAGESVSVYCSDGTTQRRIRTRIRLSGQ